MFKTNMFNFQNDPRFSSSEKRGILASVHVSGEFEDDRKKKCIDLGKRIANKRISNEDIINQVATLASRYIVWMDPINNPENGNLVKAIANGDAQFVIEYLKKHRDSRNMDIHLSQISDIFLTMMSDVELNEYAARKIIFDKLLELFGGYFIIGADLVLKPDNVLLVEDFVNIGTFYHYQEKYPNDIQVYRDGRIHSCSLPFVFSKFGDNLKYDKFTPSEFRKATKYPFPEKLRLQSELSKCAQDKIRIVDMADAADIEKRQSAREASAAASEAARKAAQDEQAESETKVEAARAAFEASGNASQSVIGANTISAKGGRRTRHKRSDKRSGYKRTNKKRSNKRSGKRSGNKRSAHKSGRR